MTWKHKTSLSKADLMDEILHRDIQNKSQKWYPLDRDVGNSITAFWV
jgi:hypothetical protein